MKGFSQWHVFNEPFLHQSLLPAVIMPLIARMLGTISNNAVRIVCVTKIGRNRKHLRLITFTQNHVFLPKSMITSICITVVVGATISRETLFLRWLRPDKG